MRAIYPPEQTRIWTGEDLARLGGKYVDIAVPASAAYRNAPGGGGDWEGGSGICVGAAFHEYNGRCVMVCWDWGGAWTWPAEQGAWVSVCDEHGDHTGVDGEWCLMNLGPNADVRA